MNAARGAWQERRLTKNNPSLSKVSPLHHYLVDQRKGLGLGVPFTEYQEHGMDNVTIKVRRIIPSPRVL